MKATSLSILLGMVLFSSSAISAQLTEGIWKQTSSSHGDCPNCTIEIERPTHHIINIKANNGWVGYAYYNQSTDSYKGAFQWKKGTVEAYENVVFLIDLTYEKNTLTMDAKSNKLNFSATYRK